MYVSLDKKIPEIACMLIEKSRQVIYMNNNRHTYPLFTLNSRESRLATYFQNFKVVNKPLERGKIG